MKATVIYGPGDVRVEDRPDARVEQPTDAVVRVVRACVCGSDLHPYHSMKPNDRGQQIGHEFIGVVEEIGSEVRGVKVGDFVISPFSFADNTCPTCRDGVHTACPNGGFFSAAQAEAVRVPQADGTLVVTAGSEDEATLKSLLTLSDVYLTGYHAVNVGHVQEGSTVTVIGDGAVGLSAVLAAKQRGAERIVLMGRHTARTDLGREFGATDVVAERGAEGVEKVKELTGGLGTQVVVEAVGHLPAFEQAIDVVRSGGTIARVGVPQFTEMPKSFPSVFYRNVTVNGGPAPVRAYLEDAIPQVLDGTIEPGRVFDRVMPLGETPEAYRAMDDREALKVMIRP